MKRQKALSVSTGRFDKRYDESTTAQDLDLCYSVSSHGEKKLKCARLNMEQVGALEKSFELEKRVEPEKKMRLARALGLHPRQIAIWFQNRRARCKTKQVEKDFGILNQDYEAFKALYLNLQEENNKLHAEIQSLSTMFENENPIETGGEAENIKDTSEGVCRSILDSQHEDLKSSMEEILMDHKVLAKLEDNLVEGEEPCYFNTDEKSHFPWDHWP
ncbi:hypothetical protein KI387_039072 [Taxus chinensis]|uniref:Homeobox domain-containing protein n=1 Tax=Taxus chinensis TaxID=29808 RepID=A0AA38CF42_TAXCH|nr:hypothetical protein KI387_039072 [Taxus chinensis]